MDREGVVENYLQELRNYSEKLEKSNCPRKKEIIQSMAQLLKRFLDHYIRFNNHSIDPPEYLELCYTTKKLNNYLSSLHQFDGNDDDSQSGPTYAQISSIASEDSSSDDSFSEGSSSEDSSSDDSSSDDSSSDDSSSEEKMKKMKEKMKKMREKIKKMKEENKELKAKLKKHKKETKRKHSSSKSVLIAPFNPFNQTELYDSVSESFIENEDKSIQKISIAHHSSSEVSREDCENQLSSSIEIEHRIQETSESSSIDLTKPE